MLNNTNIRRNGIYYLRTFGDPILNVPVPEVTEFNSSLDTIVKNMLTFLDRNAIGLAGPQVGIQRRIFVWQLDSGIPMSIINPEIIDASPHNFISTEGCLSLPGLEFKIVRYKEVVMEGYDINGNKFTTKGSELRSALFQHEIDHLDGILAISHPYRVG